MATPVPLTPILHFGFEMEDRLETMKIILLIDKTILPSMLTGYGCHRVTFLPSGMTGYGYRAALYVLSMQIGCD